jgi:ubiquinone/menaquinone biosynthesis C-methylase UbiE
MSADTVDFGRAAGDYVAYRPAFDPRLFERLRAMGVGLAGQTILDVGAGTGLLGRGLGRGDVRMIETDPKLELVREAWGTKRLVARAEDLPFDDEQLDAVTAGQCWHWFDRRVASFEIRRVLKPGGRLAIVYQTYLPIAGNVAAASETLILKYRPGWRHSGGVGINGQALKDMQSAGFEEIESFSFDATFHYTREAWRGFIRTCSAVGPSLPAETVARFDAEHAAMLRGWPERFDVPHRVFAAVASKPSARRIGAA